MIDKILRSQKKSPKIILKAPKKITPQKFFSPGIPKSAPPTDILFLFVYIKVYKYAKPRDNTQTDMIDSPAESDDNQY